MYRAQIVELRRAFESRFGANVTSLVDFNTVDGFQGQEKMSFFFMCPRRSWSTERGLLIWCVYSVVRLCKNLSPADVRRMNVALTRARASLFVLGHCPTLERSDKNWKDIISDARERGCLIEVSTSEARTHVLNIVIRLFQADADLFMRRKGKEKAPPKPSTKPQKKAAVNSQPIPTTLVAARSIGSQGTTLQHRHNDLMLLLRNLRPLLCHLC